MKNLMVFFILVSVMFIAGCTDQDDEDNFPTIFLMRIEKIEARNLSDSTTVWDAYISIDEILTPDKEYPWDTITIKILDSRKRETIQSGVYPEKYPYGEDLGDEYQVWYEELTGHPDNVDFGDLIVTTGLTEDYENAYVGIYYRKNIAGSVQLDSDFIR
jgi:hypothetical protein